MHIAGAMEGKAVDFKTSFGDVASAVKVIEDGEVIYKYPSISTRSDFMNDWNRRFCDGRATIERLTRMVDDFPLIPDDFVARCRV